MDAKSSQQKKIISLYQTVRPNCIAFQAVKQKAFSTEVGALAPVLENTNRALTLTKKYLSSRLGR